MKSKKIAGGASIVVMQIGHLVPKHCDLAQQQDITQRVAPAFVPNLAPEGQQANGALQRALRLRLRNSLLPNAVINIIVLMSIKHTHLQKRAGFPEFGVRESCTVISV